MVSQTAYADLEIRILPRELQGYPVEITLNNEQEFPRGHLDPGFLPWVASASPATDGERLFLWLLADDQLKTVWAEVRGQSPQRRIRLRIDATAPELHALPWELVRDPGKGSVPQDLAASVATPFSRYIAGKWPPGQPIVKRPIKILAAISNPENLQSTYNLSRIDVNREWAALREATAGLEVQWVLLPQPCTLPALEAALKKGYHVLHFIGHGSYHEEDTRAVLYLADPMNEVALTTESEIAAMLARQLAEAAVSEDDRLRLIFLASCDTATRSPADAFRGLAPSLVAAGVPTVLAMQDLVPVDTAREFARTFYRQLLQHGEVDLASNEARSALLTARLSGASIPVLFSRVADNKLLSPPKGEAAPVIQIRHFEPETLLIPGSSFIMGSPPSEQVAVEETPEHTVTLPTYRLGKYPVTNRDYAEFIRRARGQTEPQGSGWFLREPPGDKLDHPVVGVSWHDAQAYCRWLSAQTGRNYRLPTEAEWEKAARGPEGLRYPWGNTWEAGRCNTGNQETTPVTAYPAGSSLYGCWDMAGNVQEWTSTRWGSRRKPSDFPYPYCADDGREDLEANEYRVYRGGSLQDNPSELRCSARACAVPQSMTRARGFRVAMDI
jgi:formylglycine-generating enzyme required for sulfatase activity